MKTTRFIFKLLFLIGVLYSCQRNDVKKYYYNTGELWIVEKVVDKEKGIYYSQIYNKKGNLESEGYSNKDGLWDGDWKEYFSDGKLRWRGRVDNGHKIIEDSVWNNLEAQRAILEIDGHPKVLKIGQKYKIRTYVEGVDTDAYIVTYSNYKEIEYNKEDPERYPFYIIPKKVGNMDILYLFEDSNGYIKANDPHLSFHLRVEE